MPLRIQTKPMVGAATLFATLAIASCLKEPDYRSIAEIIKQRSELDGKQVGVRGFIVVDALDHPNFLEEIGPPNGERVTRSIDLVAANPSVRTKFLRSNGACVIAYGVFHLYGPHTITTGNLVSVYGQVETTSLHSCNG